MGATSVSARFCFILLKLNIMDIIITAPLGGGKTHTGLDIIMRSLGETKVGAAVRRTALPDRAILRQGARVLASYLRDLKPDAVMFDGCISTPDDLLAAVGGVKILRETTGRTNLLAVYCDPGHNVVLTNGHGVDFRNANKFISGAEAFKIADALISPDKHLQKLWDDVLLTPGGVEAVRDALKAVGGTNVSELTSAQQVDLHGRLLKLLK